jgi:ABC-type sugar transport system permease subunit
VTSSAVTSAAETASRSPRRSPRRPSRSNRHGGQGVLALLFLAPLFAFYGVYYVYAFVFLGQTSRTRVGLSFIDAVDVGWQNYQLVVTDNLFQRAVFNNLLFAGVSILAALTLGFFVAMLLATGVRAHGALYLVFLLPSLIPLSLFATVFGRMLGASTEPSMKPFGLSGSAG